MALTKIWGLLAACPVRAFEPGATVIEVGRPNRTLYLVLSGRLRVDPDAAVGSDEVGTIEAGQPAGEVSLLDSGSALRQVSAEQVTRVLAIDEDTFWQLIERSHDFAVNLLLLLTERLRASNKRSEEVMHQKRSFEHDAQVDALTSLFNRRWLDQQLPRLVQRYVFGAEPCSVLMLDIDHFKRFNDEFGHFAGDQVLVAVARTIQRCVRPTDLCARFGGEELVVVLPHTALSGALVAAERLRSAICAMPTATIDGIDLPTTTVSIGVATLEPGESAATLLSRADVLLYEAKRQGRNRVIG